MAQIQAPAQELTDAPCVAKKKEEEEEKEGHCSLETDLDAEWGGGGQGAWMTGGLSLGLFRNPPPVRLTYSTPCTRVM